MLKRSLTLVLILLSWYWYVSSQPIIFSPTLRVDVWVDKGCGEVYFMGEDVIIYFRANNDTTLTLVDDYGWGTHVLFRGKVKGGKIYSIYGKITFPSSYRRFYVYAFDKEGRIAYDECKITVREKEEEPDLAVASITFSPEVPKEGEMVVISARVISLVPTDTGYFNVNFYVDGALVGSDRVKLLGSAPVTGVSITWRIPHGAAGRHTIRVVVDANDEVEEVNEDNNVLEEEILVLASSTPSLSPWQPVTVEAEGELPDLSVGNITLIPYPPKEGFLALITVDILNLGSEVSEAFNVTFYLDNSSIGFKRVERIPKGLYTRVSLFWEVPEGLIGEHYLTVIADEENVISELNEENNSQTLKIMIEKSK